MAPSRVSYGAGGKVAPQEYLGKYRMLKCVGRGGFGEALLVEDPTQKEGRRLRIAKRLNLGSMSDKEKQFAMNEVMLLAQFSDHPFVVKYHEAFIRGTSLFVIMDYCENGDLSHRLTKLRKSNAHLTAGQVLKHFVQLVAAVSHMHQAKVLHRDLKPSNILIDSSGRLRVSDFGISKCFTTVELANTQLGTPTYMSPELLKRQPYTYPSDVWSLGCILYELISLNRPFDGISLSSLVQNIKTQKPPPLPGHVPTSLRELCFAMLNKDPLQRPTMSDIIAHKDVQKGLAEMLKNAERSKSVET